MNKSLSTYYFNKLQQIRKCMFTLMELREPYVFLYLFPPIYFPNILLHNLLGGGTLSMKDAGPPVLPIGLYLATTISPCFSLRALPTPSSFVDFQTTFFVYRNAHNRRQN